MTRRLHQALVEAYFRLRVYRDTAAGRRSPPPQRQPARVQARAWAPSRPPGWPTSARLNTQAIPRPQAGHTATGRAAGLARWLGVVWWATGHSCC